jgi:O-antigen/teichoic acid export membrane protein
LAVIWHSAAVFIWGMIAAAAFEVLISFIFFADRPTLKFVPDRVKQILRNGRNLNIATALSYVLENIDNVLIGKFTTTAQLGIYQQGYALSHTFNVDLAKSVQHSTFPVYARIESDRPRLAKAYLKATLGGLLLFSALSLPVGLLSNWLVTVYLGSQWQGVEVILPLLLVAGMVQSFLAMTSSLFVARKQYFWLNSYLTVNTIVLIVLLIALTPTGGIMGGVQAVLWSRLSVVPLVVFGACQTLQSKKKS